MKTTTTIANLTQEDLVDLFSTALYGSNYLSADWDDDLPTSEEDCFEDTLAKILLAGGYIYVRDHYAEGTTYRDWAELDEEENGIYRIFLIDIIKGLERAANGEFKAGENDEYSPDWRERNLNFARRSFNAYAYDEREWDAITADCLMQIILFDEIVYG